MVVASPLQKGNFENPSNILEPLAGESGRGRKRFRGLGSKTGIKEGQPDPEPLVGSEGSGVDIAQFPRADSGDEAYWRNSGEKSHEEKRRRARR